MMRFEVGLRRGDLFGLADRKIVARMVQRSSVARRRSLDRRVGARELGWVAAIRPPEMPQRHCRPIALFPARISLSWRCSNVSEGATRMIAFAPPDAKTVYRGSNQAFGIHRFDLWIG